MVMSQDTARDLGIYIAMKFYEPAELKEGLSQPQFTPALAHHIEVHFGATAARQFCAAAAR